MGSSNQLGYFETIVLALNAFAIVAVLAASFGIGIGSLLAEALPPDLPRR